MSQENRTKDTIETAVQLAAAGEYAAADKALERLTELERTQAPVCVVRAKIKAQQGRHAEAIVLWQQALKADPENKEALQGLSLSSAMAAKWGTSFFFLRANLLYALFLVTVLILAGLVLWLGFNRELQPHAGHAEIAKLDPTDHSATVPAGSARILPDPPANQPGGAAPAQTGVGQAAIPAPAIIITPPPIQSVASQPAQVAGSAATEERILIELHKSQEEFKKFRQEVQQQLKEKATTPPPSPPPPSPRRPDIRFSAGGVTLREDGSDATALELFFDKGLFLAGTELTVEARATLSQLGKEIDSQSAKIGKVEIVGYSDSVPFATEGGDHIDLGFERAKTVANLLRGIWSLPPEVVTLSSLGQQRLPYPDTTENSGRNRTVKIRFVNR
jgi:flagellar motor protein MotB